MPSKTANPSRRDLMRMSAGGAAAFLPGCSASRRNRPNIVVILADDLGFSDLGCFGGEITTPNLDRFAAEGTRWTQFYTCAVCVTSRSSLMTGLHPRFGEGGRLRPGMVTLAETLREAGYTTVMTGKWHLGNASPNRPIDRGFDEFYGLLSGACNYFDPSVPDPEYPNKPDSRKEERIFVHNTKRLTRFPDGFYTTDAFTEHAVREITRNAQTGKPFFLHLAYNAPHFPLQAFPEDIARYRNRYAAGYEEMRKQRLAKMRDLGIIQPNWRLPNPENKTSDWRYDYESAPWVTVETREREQRMMEIYAAMVERMDRGVGRVMNALRSTGADANTIVFFLSDNGGCATLPREPDRQFHVDFNRGKQLGSKESYEYCGPGWAMVQSTPFRRYKTWTYEGGIATPFIARWPGLIPRNSISHSVGHLVDFMPTLLELADVRYPRSHNGGATIPQEGQSLLPAMLNGVPARERSLGWFLYGSRAFRQGRWKIVWPTSSPRWELYDMERDRTETHDLAAQEPVIAGRLSKRWHEWAQLTGAPVSGTPADRDVY